MKNTTILTALLLLAAPHVAAAEEGGLRSLGVCKAVAGGEGADLSGLSEDDLKEKLCLSSLSVVRSADPMAQMSCRLAFKTLLGEFSKRHPGKEMTEVYGRC